MTVRVGAPAKVNLSLAVGPRRADGYHDIATVFHAVSLSDEITLSPGRPGRGVRLSMTGPGSAELPVDGTNLAVRAIEMLASSLGVPPDVDARLVKAIPVAGGMAGGSADAAAALVGAASLWGAAGSLAALGPIAASLGSDVPFALHGGTALGTGRGEDITPILQAGTLHWVVALSEGTLATPAVYAEFDRLHRAEPAPEPEIPRDLLLALRDGDPARIAGHLRNDLQPAAVSLRPTLAEVLSAGEEAGALAGIVSGSGPTCAFLVTDHAAAVDVAVALSSIGGVRRALPVVGPVPGARVLAG